MRFLRAVVGFRLSAKIKDYDIRTKLKVHGNEIVGKRERVCVKRVTGSPMAKLQEAVGEIIWSTNVNKLFFDSPNLLNYDISPLFNKVKY